MNLLVEALNESRHPPMEDSSLQKSAVMDDFANNPWFELAPIAYSVLDVHGVQLAANRQFHALFGHPAGTELTATQLTHPEDQARSAEFLTQLIASKETMRSIEKRYIRADGSTFWGRLTASVINVDGHVRLLGVIENIQTEHDLLEHLAEEVERRSSFVSQVSHELRNPLHLICGTSELLSVQAAPGTHREQARSINREATALSRLVDDLLDVGRSDAGELSVKHQPFSMQRIADRLRSSVIGQANAKGIALEVNVDPSCPSDVLGDADRVHQIVLNLATNALKFTSAGTVCVDITPTAGDHISFRVTDTGPGIPEESLDRVFQPFVRLGESEPGAGLGLAISRRLADLLGATLTAENCAPVGAAFELTIPLPAHQRLLDGSADLPDEIPAQTVGAHILIVEDNVENQLLATAQLGTLGYTSEVAPDGFDAIQRMETHRYDAVLMDWHLPEMDGLETTRRIRDLEAAKGQRRTPIIALTARTMSSDVEECYRAGVDAHIGKPATLAMISGTLNHWISTDNSGASQIELESLIDDTVEAIGDRQDVPLLDHECFERLFNELGGADVTRSIVDTYLDQLDSRVETVRQADNHEAVENAAHVLGSTSAMLGAKAMEHQARSIERNAREGLVVDDAARSELLAIAAATATTLRSAFDREVAIS